MPSEIVIEEKENMNEIIFIIEGTLENIVTDLEIDFGGK